MKKIKDLYLYFKKKIIQDKQAKSLSFFARKG